MTAEHEETNSRSHTTAEDANDSGSDKEVEVVQKFMKRISQQRPRPKGIDNELFMPGDLYNLGTGHHANLDAQQDTPPTHTAPASSSGSPMSSVKKGKKRESGAKEKGELKRNRASHNRLHSEFGWQMSLQAPKGNSVPPTVPETEELKDEQPQAPNGDTPNGNVMVEDEDASKKLEPELIMVEELKPPSVHRKDKSDTGSTTSSKLSKNLAKKEFGWQLALQENIGSITPRSSHLKDIQLDSQKIDGLSTSEEEEVKPPSQLSVQAPQPKKPPVDAKAVVEDLDASVNQREEEHKPHPSGSSTVQLDQPFLNFGSTKSRLNLEEQLHNPVRSEFGWQVGLATKSLTFPLSKATPWTPVAEDPDTSEFGAFATNNAAAVSARSLLYDTDWRLVGGSDGPGEPSIRTRESPEVAEFSCQLCFGNLPLTDVRGMEGCDHSFCLPCLQHHILDTLSRETFPIECPACDPTEEVRGILAENVIAAANLYPNDLDRYYVLLLRSLPVEVECPGCRSTQEVPWVSFNNRSWFQCLTCTERWCKACHKSVPRVGGINHMCLPVNGKEPRKKRKEGRKQPRFCPECGNRTASVGKKSNTVLCSNRGCQCHFCYVCSGIMADGTTSTDIQSAIAAHNRANPACAPSKHDCTIQ